MTTDDPARFSKLFGALDEAGRKRLLELSTKRQHQAGDVICREGEAGDDFFVITRGTVTVSGDDFGTSKTLATLGAGQFFGELTALSGQPRQATVTAAEALELLCISRAAVDEVLKANPAAHALLQRAGLHRVEETMKTLAE